MKTLLLVFISFTTFSQSRFIPAPEHTLTILSPNSSTLEHHPSSTVMIRAEDCLYGSYLDLNKSQVDLDVKNIKTLQNIIAFDGPIKKTFNNLILCWYKISREKGKTEKESFSNTLDSIVTHLDKIFLKK